MKQRFTDNFFLSGLLVDHDIRLPVGARKEDYYQTNNVDSSSPFAFEKYNAGSRRKDVDDLWMGTMPIPYVIESSIGKKYFCLGGGRGWCQDYCPKLSSFTDCRKIFFSIPQFCKNTVYLVLFPDEITSIHRFPLYLCYATGLIRTKSRSWTYWSAVDLSKWI